MPDNINLVVSEFLNKIRTILGNRIKKVILYGSYDIKLET